MQFAITHRKCCIFDDIQLGSDKVLDEEIMTNDDNLESNILTSNLLKMLVQVLLQVESEICYCVDPDPE